MLGNIADIIIETYGMESSYLRTMKLVAARDEAACASGDELRTMLAAARRLAKCTRIDSVHLREEIAKGFTEKGKWEL